MRLIKMINSKKIMIKTKYKKGNQIKTIKILIKMKIKMKTHNKKIKLIKKIIKMNKY